ncbi:MAG: carboxypeptidase regulatory-like domain-containing protein, partial [Bacteroidia bacterium]
MFRIKLFLLFVAISSTVKAQVTTSEIRGNVKSKTNETLPGAVVVAVHEPTSTKYYASTFNDGSFVLPNLKTGGLYEITVSYVGFIQEKKSNIYLSLGETKYIEFELSESAQELSEVEITAKQNDPFDSKRRGTGTTIEKEKIENLPTLNRGLQDVTKLTPQSTGNSYGGSNYRFNNLNIDGTGSNDAFGFQEPASGAGGSTANGTPGALAKTQPISLDAIEQIQVNISPYDVKLGNFTGASINAVTRSGTNKTEGSVYFFDRNQYTTGKSVDASRSRIANYSDIQSGFRVGGALKKDKLFYFINSEYTNKSESVQFAPGSNGSSFSYQDIKNLKDTIQKRYGYDAGSIDDIVLNTASYKLFTRLDWNINKKNQFLIRINYVNGYSDNLERAPTILNFGSQGFRHISKSLNVVAELKTRVSNNLSNNLIVGFGNLHDNRDPFGDQMFPHIEITYNTSNLIFLGTYREAAVFQMKQRNYELTDNLVYYKNKHTFTFGTHTEFFNFNYHFVTPYNGRWAYKSINDFYANKPSRIRGTYNLSDDSYSENYNNPSADFQVILPSLYVQHDYKFNARLRLSYGLRLEGNLFPVKPNLLNDFQTTPQFSDVQSGIQNQLIVSP